jgi:hypothetical protein
MRCSNGTIGSSQKATAKWKGVRVGEPPAAMTRKPQSFRLFLAAALDTKIVILDRLVLVLEIEGLFQVVAVLISRFLKAFFRIGAGYAKSKSDADRCKGDKTFHGTSFRVMDFLLKSSLFK